MLVVYFDQCFGAEKSKRLSKFDFSHFCTFLQDFDAKIMKNEVKMMKASFWGLFRTISLLYFQPLIDTKTKNGLRIFKSEKIFISSQEKLSYYKLVLKSPQKEAFSMVAKRAGFVIVRFQKETYKWWHKLRNQAVARRIYF